MAGVLFNAEPMPGPYGTYNDDGPTGQPLYQNDAFDWHQVEYQPPTPVDNPFEPGQVVDQVTRSSADSPMGVPQVEKLGPVKGQTWLSPWFGNSARDLNPQVSQPARHFGPARGGTSADVTWNSWLAANEVPDSTIASEVFASVKAFPYAFRNTVPGTGTS